MLKANCLAPLAFPSPPGPLPAYKAFILPKKMTLTSPILLLGTIKKGQKWYKSRALPLRIFCEGSFIFSLRHQLFICKKLFSEK
jgi:hypothetical protein